VILDGFIDGLRALGPECVTVATLIAVLGADLKFGASLPPGARSHRVSGLAAFGLVLAALLAWTGGLSAESSNGVLRVWPSLSSLKAVIFLLGAGAAWISAGSLKSRHPAEFLALLLLSAVGLSLVIGSENLLMIFIAFELVSLSLYAMAAFDKSSRASTEAALKYFLFGGVAAAFTLFGFSLLYGVSGSLRVPEIGAALRGHAGDPLVLAALVFMMAGLAFKIASAPFHFWAPDVYEGAPAATAAFVASGSKIGGFVLLWRIVGGLSPVGGSGAWGGMTPGWEPVLALIAAASMVLGNLAALSQTSLRRLLAYSAVAHAGYALLAVLGGPDGGPAVAYYAVTYAATLIGIFAIVAAFPASVAIKDLAGLGARSPFAAGLLTIFVLSLAGIPPLSGFFGKLFAFTAVARAHGDGGLFWLVVVALAASCVSLYYYLRVLKAVWIEAPAEGAPAHPVNPSFVVMSLAAFAVVVAGLLPGWVLSRFA
jgi:NADH-quinone oxidoreductase subunit N